MTLSLSTRWNARRHTSGEAMIEEILALGLRHVELGFDLTLDLLPGVKKMVRNGSVTVTSVHNFCPVPVAAPAGHPELFQLVSLESRVRDSALTYTLRTIDCASEFGAGVVVFHAGNVDMRNLTRELHDLHQGGRQFSSAYEKTRMKLLVTREKKARRQIEYLYKGLETILPALKQTGVKLGIEIQPHWECVPSETELEALIRHFGNEHIGYWHDLGHAQVRQNLGFISHLRWLEKLLPWLYGVHVHDVSGPVSDHLMPPQGDIDFRRFRFLAERGTLLVLEPSPSVSTEDMKRGIEFLNEVWAVPRPSP